jgi:SSS family solute:Na+ symporter
MTPEEHLRYLKLAAIGVAVFAFCFSTLFRQTQYIQLYWQVTGAIYGGGAGAVIIGGLYWRRGTTIAAWITMCVGATFALTGIVFQHFYPDLWFLHGQYVSFMTMIVAITTYVTVSLLTSRELFNMDKMLHRGKYSVAGEEKLIPPPFWKRFNPARLIGIDEEFSFWDRVISFSIFGWIMITLTISMIGLVWNLIHPWSTTAWIQYWFIFGLIVPFVASIVTTVWFTIGGIYEIRVFFQRIRVEKRNLRDDGTVGPGHP